MPDYWVRRCLRCRTLDTRMIWDNPADAHSQGRPEHRRWWRFNRRRWECPHCDSADYTVEREELPG